MRKWFWQTAVIFFMGIGMVSGLWIREGHMVSENSGEKGGLSIVGSLTGQIADAAELDDGDGDAVRNETSETEIANEGVMSENAEEDKLILNARAAVLMDADSGRVLYGKDADTPWPMASTTKIMTLILALENGNGEDTVTASAYAASMPQVRLGVREGEQFRMEDLYYAMMLESYNDAAVMIAEEIAGSVEDFAVMMNEKAKELGCTGTHFVTPNGLDGSDAGGMHASTARDMALIMRYVIDNEEFLKITQTRSYSFTSVDGKHSFTVNNKNTLFDRMEGAISGKTGFTGEAGYCYVCAVQMGERRLTAAFLGSGWPPHKNYKWQDVRTLMDYGRMYYDTHTVYLRDLVKDCQVHVAGGEDESAVLMVPQRTYKLLMREGERLRVSVLYPGELQAPLQAGEPVGLIRLWVDDHCVGESSFLAERDVEREERKGFLSIFSNK